MHWVMAVRRTLTAECRRAVISPILSEFASLADPPFRWIGASLRIVANSPFNRLVPDPIERVVCVKF